MSSLPIEPKPLAMRMPGRLVMIAIVLVTIIGSVRRAEGADRPHFSGTISAVQRTQSGKLESFIVKRRGKELTVRVGPKTEYWLLLWLAENPHWQYRQTDPSAVVVGLRVDVFFRAKHTSVSGPAVQVRLRPKTIPG